MKQHITAPAPRFLLRYFFLKQLLKQHSLVRRSFEEACEIGPGLGDVSSFFTAANDVTQMNLFEGSAQAREILEKRFRGNGNISVRNEFSQDDNRYQIVLCFEVIEHIENDEAFLTSIFASLKQEGWFIGSVPAYMRKWQAIDELAGHFRRYEPSELYEKLSNAGFTDISVYIYGFPLTNIMFPFRQLAYGKKVNKRTSTDKAEMTAKSGISRRTVRGLNTTLVYAIVKIASSLQRLPGLSRLGDGLIFTCRKK
ncbi:class I SAM-dependent methyltransferase [Allohahella sp. A8]|uniref:class I SAM-dependent methyltransferase n=1 Tax=Allohahella sp. A8 TaxID=3141461 RepID=UPI003A804A39